MRTSRDQPLYLKNNSEIYKLYTKESDHKRVKHHCLDSYFSLRIDDFKKSLFFYKNGETLEYFRRYSVSCTSFFRSKSNNNIIFI